MKKRIVFTSKSLPRVKDKGKALRRVNAEHVIEALGAERTGAMTPPGSPIAENSARIASVAKIKSTPPQPNRTITIELDDEEMQLLTACMAARSEHENRNITIEDAIHFTLKEGGLRCNSQGWAADSEIMIEINERKKRRA